MHQYRRKLTSAFGIGIAVGALTLLAVAPALPAQAAPPVTTGSFPVGIAVNENNHRVIVANGLLTTVTIFDGSDVSPTKLFLNVGGEPAGIAVDSGLQLAFVTLPAAGKVAVVDLGAATPTLLRTITVGTAPNTVAVDPVLHRVFVVNNGSANVSSFIGDDAAPTITTIGVGASPEGIGIDTSNHTVYVASSATSTVARFSGSDAMPTVAAVAGVRNAGAIAVDSRTHTAFVVDGAENTVFRFSTATAAPTLETITVAGTPGGIVADSASGEVYVSARTTGSLVHFDGTVTGTPLQQAVSVGTNPVSLALDASSGSRMVYVANRGGTNVSRVEAVSPQAPVITSGAPPAATVGVPYSFQFTATAHPSASFVSTLPIGSQFGMNTDGLLAGTPNAVGPVTFTLEATNGIAPAATQTVTIQVNAAPTTTPTPTPTSTPSPTGTSTPTPTATGGPGTGGGSGAGGGSGTGTGTGGGGTQGNGGSGNGASSGSGSGGLAHTGLAAEAIAPIGVAGLLLLAAGAAVVVNRRAGGKRS